MHTVHTLITRFNLATPGREQAFRQSPDWLAGRFDLFERYCLPSVRDQTSSDFIWLVLFDSETPQWARERIVRAQAVCRFDAVFTPLFDNAGWARLVRDAIGPVAENRVVLTSNLDNDDAIAADYLERVRDAAIANWRGETFAINVTAGLVLARRRLYRFVHPANAFTTLVEGDSDRLRTTMTIRHNELAHHVPIIQVGGTPGWLQVVHDNNVSNRVRGSIVAQSQATRFAAAILAEAEPPTVAEIMLDRWFQAPARRLRDAAIATVRRVLPVDRPGAGARLLRKPR